MAAQSVVCNSTRSAGCYNDYPNNQCGFTKIGSNNQTWELAAQLCHSAGFSVAGVESKQETWCSNTLTPDCPRLPQKYCNETCGANTSQTCGQGWTLEPIQFDCAPGPPPPLPTAVGLSVRWGKLYYNISGDHSIIADSAAEPLSVLGAKELIPVLPSHESRRDSVQRQLSRGWGPWLHHNILSIVKLPEAATITTELCQVSTGDCISHMTPDGLSKRAAVPCKF